MLIRFLETRVKPAQAIAFASGPIGTNAMGSLPRRGTHVGGVALALALLASLSGCQPQQDPQTLQNSAVNGAEQSGMDTTAVEPNSNSTGQNGKTGANDGATSGNIPVEPRPVQAQSSSTDRALQPGRHCYQLKSETESVTVVLDVASDHSVTGKVDGVVHNAQQGYYTSYGQEIDGRIDGNLLPVTLLTRIELDLQQNQETWQLANNQLMTGPQSYRDALAQIDCSSPSVGNPDFVTPPTSTLSPATAPVNAQTEGASRVITQRVSLVPGHSETRLEDAVVRGERMQYLVGAEAGQTLFLTLASVEQNALMDLIGPDGSVIWTGKTGDKLVLPQSGDYQVIVGGVRGNATYALTISILSLGE